jgi:hypothetical protein
MKVTIVDPVAPTAASTKPNWVTARATDVVVNTNRSANPARNVAGRRTHALSRAPMRQPVAAAARGKGPGWEEEDGGSNSGSQARAAREERERRQAREGCDWRG